MADFKQAVEWMKEGKKVYCTDYEFKHYYELEEDALIGDNGVKQVFMADMLYVNYEIYEEDKDWNLADNIYKRIRGSELLEFKDIDIKKCRDLIIKDMAKKTFSCHGDFIKIVEKRLGDLL